MIEFLESLRQRKKIYFFAEQVLILNAPIVMEITVTMSSIKLEENWMSFQ